MGPKLDEDAMDQAYILFYQKRLVAEQDDYRSESRGRDGGYSTASSLEERMTSFGEARRAVSVYKPRHKKSVDDDDFELPDLTLIEALRRYPS
jgi:hypothetical protein